MKKMIFAICLAIFVVRGETDPRELRQKKEDKFQLVMTNGNKIKCNSELLITYGLKGYEYSDIVTHKYCPKLTNNCCTPEDQEASMAQWNQDYKHRIERHYEIFIYSMKYLLGFTNEAFNLAKRFEDHPAGECSSAAKDLIQMNFNPEMTLDVFTSFQRSIREISKLRQGFFCVLCDGNTQEKLKDFWSSSNLFSKDKIYYSKDFCRKLVEQSIHQTFYSVFYVKRYLENMSELISCATNTSEHLIYDIPIKTAMEIKNCYYFKNKYFFFFCGKYCENFHLTSVSPIFDGDVRQLKKFVDLVSAHRKAAFSYPDNNLLVDSVSYEETYLKDNFEEVLKDPVFVRPIVQQNMLDNYTSEFVYYGGVEITTSVDGALYPIELPIEGRALILTIALFFVLLL